MAIKIVDELQAMGNFPIVHAEGINLVKEDGTEDNLQNLFDNGELGGGGDSSVTLTQEEYEALPEEERLNGLYYTYDTKRIYKNGVQYGASEPIPLTMEEYKTLKEAGAIDEQQEYLVEADAEGILLGAEDIGYNNAESGIQATTVQGAIDKVSEKVDGLISDTTSTSSTWSSSKINNNLSYKTNFNVTSMTELGFTKDSYVSVKDFWNKLVSRFGTNGTIRFSWMDTNKAYLGTSNNNVVINGGTLIYTTYGSPAEWRDFSAIYVGSYNDVVFHIRCAMTDSNDANTVWSITSLLSPINDSSTSKTSTWSSKKISDEVESKYIEANIIEPTDWDTLNTKARYYFSGVASMTNSPEAVPFGLLEVIDVSIYCIVQRYFDFNNGKLYMRRWSGNSWNDWYKFDSTAI